jgi:hypothetical protein
MSVTSKATKTVWIKLKKSCKIKYGSVENESIENVV